MADNQITIYEAATGWCHQVTVSNTGRFWGKVDKREPGECWPWLGAASRDGYGNFWIGPRRCVPAHRFAYLVETGPIPEGLELDHLCRNRACVNPVHLEPVTHKANMERSVEHARAQGHPRTALKTHCIRGHALTDENLYLKPSGERRCRTCDRLRGRASVARVSVSVQEQRETQTAWVA